MIEKQTGMILLAGVVIGSALGYMLPNGGGINPASITTIPAIQKVDCDAREAFTIGEQSLRSGDLSKAGLHFARAMACAPGNWEQLQSYATDILGHANTLVKRGEPEKAVGLLSDLELFMRNQAQYLNLDGLKQLSESLEQIRGEMDTAMARLPQQYKTAVPDDTYTDLENYVKETIRELREMLEKDDENDDDSLVLYQLGLIDASLQKLVLLSEFREKNPQQQNGLVEMIKSFDGLKEDISTEISKNILTLLRKELTKLNAGKIENKGKNTDYRCSGEEIGEVQTLINARVEFGKKVLRETAKISSEPIQNEAMSILEYNQDKLAEIQRKQRKRYEEGAIESMKKFYKKYNDVDTILTTDEGAIREIMIDILAEIDTRLLGMSVQAGYNELFSMAYATLDEEQKITLSWKMANISKKLLCSF